jgi:hypothetical protein
MQQEEATGDPLVDIGRVHAAGLAGFRGSDHAFGVPPANESLQWLQLWTARMLNGLAARARVNIIHG